MSADEANMKSAVKAVDCKKSEEATKTQPIDRQDTSQDPIQKKKKGWFKRLLRISFIIFASALNAYVCELSADRYFQVWVQTSIDSTDVHISEIPFPAVTICPMRIASLTENEATQTLSIDKAKLAQYERMTLMAQHIIEDSPESDKLTARDFSQNRDFDKMLIDDLFGFVDYTCEDLFERCFWRRKNISCCSLFRRLTTVEGSCYTFNSQFAKDADSSWPWSVARAGPFSGLSVFINRNINGNTVNKIFVSVHDSKEYLTPNTFYSAGERIIVPVEPQKFSADYDVTARPLTMRHCRFQGENEFHYQTQSDCILKCHMAHVFRKCNCSYLYDIPMPIASGNLEHDTDMFRMAVEADGNAKRRCQVRDLLCFHENRHSFFTMGNIIVESESDAEFSTYNCQCYPDCNRVQYRTATYTEKVANAAGDSASVELEVYFQEETLFSYHSMLRFTLLDLMVSFGGIAGLCLGVSMVGIFDCLLNCLSRCKRREDKTEEKNKYETTLSD